MVGGLLRIAFNIGAYSAAHAATRGTIQWSTGAFRNAVQYMVRRGGRVGGMGKFLQGVEHEVTAGARFLEERGRQIARAQSAPTARLLRNIHRSVRDEAYALPMNYLYYRMEKNQAITPEERDQTRNFAKFYFGVPMASSIATGVVMNQVHVLQGARRAAIHLAKRIPQQTIDRAVHRLKPVIGTRHRGLQAVTDRMVAAARAKDVASSGRGVLQLLATNPISRVASKFSDAYRTELRVLQHAPTQFEQFTTNLKALQDVILSGTREYSKKNNEFINRQVKNLREHELREYKQHFSRGRVARFMHEAVGARYTRQTVPLGGGVSISGPRDAGSFEIGTDRTPFELGTLSPVFMKDALIRGVTKSKVGGWVLGLFGQAESVRYRESVNSLTTAYHPITRSSMLTFNKAYVASSPEETVDDILLKVLGLERGQLKKEAQWGRFKSFKEGRVEAILEGLGVERNEENLSTGRKLLQISLAHGQLPLKRGDILVHSASGEMSLISNVKSGSRSAPVKNFMKIGALGKGDYMRFMKFETNSGSLTAKVIRDFHGSTSVSPYFHTTREEGRTRGTDRVSMGPGLVPDKIPAFEKRGLMGWIKRTFELGEGEEQTFLGRALNAGRKHANPRYLPTLMHWMKEPGTRSSLYANERSLDDTLTVLLSNARQANLDFYATLVEKTGGTNGAVDVLERIVRRAGLHNIYPDFDAANLFIRDNDVVKSATEVKGTADAYSKLRSVLTVLRGRDDVGGLGSAQSGRLNTIYKDLERSFEGIRARLSYAIPGEASPRAATMLGMEAPITEINDFHIRGHLRGRMRYIDQYNADVLTTLMGVSSRLEYDEFKSATSWFTPTTLKNAIFHEAPTSVTGPRELSSFMTGAHLSHLHHKLGQEFNRWSRALTENEIGTVKHSIDSIVATFNGTAGLDDVLRYTDTRARFKPYAPFDSISDKGSKMSPFDQITLVPGRVPEKYRAGIGRTTVTLPLVGDVEVAEGIMDASNVSVMSLARAFNRTANEMLGIGFSEQKTPTVGSYMKKMLTKRILPVMGLALGYSAVDRLADRYLEGTPFGEGLTVFGANVLAGSRLAAQNIMDLTRITDVSKYLEDLMPGIITSPLSGLARGIGPVLGGLSLGYKSGGPRGALTGGIIGGAIGAITGGLGLGIFGEWDISKSRKELVWEFIGEDEVAVRKGRWWELGSTPFEGTRIEYYRPHMYHLLRSRYKQAPGLKDSMLTEAVGALAPDIYAMKNYYTRPYPTTAGILSDIPVFSNVMAMAPGLPLFGGIPMHRDQPTGLPSRDAAGWLGRGSNNPAYGASMFQNYGDQYLDTGHGWSFDNRGMITEPPASRSAFDTATSETVGNVKDIVGLRGFIVGSAFADMTGRNDLFDFAPELASPTDITGIRRSYWDLELGGLLGTSEVIRRYIPRRRPQVETFNPIRNTMPTWLPGKDYMVDFQHGDPYTVVPLGEARLPGPSYEAVHDVSLAFPIESTVLGEAMDSQLSYFLGHPEYMATRNKMQDEARYVADEVRENARSYGMLVKGLSALYNPNYDVHAVADAVLRTGEGAQMPVRVVPKGFAGESDLNAYLVLGNVDRGMLIEVDPSTGATVERSVKRDVRRFAQELEQAHRSQERATSNIAREEARGRSVNLANAYSWFDRMRILADVAPYSPEYREASSVVDQQLLTGSIDSSFAARVEKIKQQVSEKKKPYQTSEYRFLYMGEAVTPQAQRLDQFYAGEYSFTEQMAGAAWEKLSHLQNPVSQKLMHKASALEEYQRTALYGKAIKQWQSPVGDFLASYYYQGINVTDPAQGMVSWGTAGMLLGGAPIAGAMALAGAATSVYNSVTDSVHLPSRVEERREMQEQYDAYQYARYLNLYSETGNPSYKSLASKTMTGLAMRGGTMSPEAAALMVPKPEKDFITDIINNVKSSQMGRVGKLLPVPAAASLNVAAGNLVEGSSLTQYYEGEVLGCMVPGEERYYDQMLQPESLMVNTMQQQGVEAHDAGFGWYSQLADMARAKRLGTFDEGMDIYGTNGARVGVRDFLAASNEQGKIRELLQSYAAGINIVDDGNNSITLDITVRA